MNREAPFQHKFCNYAHALILQILGAPKNDQENNWATYMGSSSSSQLSFQTIFPSEIYCLTYLRSSIPPSTLQPLVARGTSHRQAA